MTKIKLCGLMDMCDIIVANELMPEYIGFVFAPASKRFISKEQAVILKQALNPGIEAVGVFVDEDVRTVAGFLNSGIIDVAQIHGNEDNGYIEQLRKLTDKQIIQAFRINTADEADAARESIADYILFDSGAGTGNVFDWSMLQGVHKPFFLAGGLSPANVETAVQLLHPYAVDVSSGIETDGAKDKMKMKEFVAKVRKEEKK